MESLHFHHAFINDSLSLCARTECISIIFFSFIIRSSRDRHTHTHKQREKEYEGGRLEARRREIKRHIAYMKSSTLCQWILVKLYWCLVPGAALRLRCTIIIFYRKEKLPKKKQYAERPKQNETKRRHTHTHTHARSHTNRSKTH